MGQAAAARARAAGQGSRRACEHGAWCAGCPGRALLTAAFAIRPAARWPFPHPQAPKKKTEKVVENVELGPQVKEGELVFGVAHIFASFNDTFVHVTDLSGKETIVRVTGTLAVAEAA